MEDIRSFVLKEWRADYVGALLDMADEFTLEATDYSWTPNRDHHLQTFHNYFEQPDTDVILVYSGDTLAAGAMAAIENDHQDETIGYGSKFYVRPAFRGTRVGRTLLNALVDWFDAKGCVDSFVTSTGGVGNDSAFINLFAKEGYKPCGVCLRRNHVPN